DIGTAVPVTFAVSDGRITASTNVTVTVVANHSLDGLTLVRDYSWLQLPAEKVTASAGLVNDDLTEGREMASYDQPAMVVRWGQARWMPSHDTSIGTDYAQSNHFVAVTFDAPRHVDKVKLHIEVWQPLLSFYIDGTVDGETWVPIYTRSSLFPTGGHRLDLPVESGFYRAIRLRLMAGDYSAEYWSYGLHLLEPYGTAALPPEEVNWANRPNFETTKATLGLNEDWADFMSGTLVNDDGVRTGQNPGSFAPYPAAYAEIDLGEKRWCHSVTVLWTQYYGTDFAVYASEEADGDDFAPVENPVLASSCQRETTLSFAPVRARRIRVADAIAGGTGHTLFNQVLVTSCPKPVKGTVIIVR
ncbi:MAG: hypothetical protein FWF84_08120, partial [Kiritimatiellaeota bacterium]|nr:hypothetical protein [Kiritimatiellota bacterium]